MLKYFILLGIFWEISFVICDPEPILTEVQLAAKLAGVVVDQVNARKNKSKKHAQQQPQTIHQQIPNPIPPEPQGRSGIDSQHGGFQSGTDVHQGNSLPPQGSFQPGTNFQQNFGQPGTNFQQNFGQPGTGFQQGIQPGLIQPQQPGQVIQSLQPMELKMVPRWKLLFNSPLNNIQGTPVNLVTNQNIPGQQQHTFNQQPPQQHSFIQQPPQHQTIHYPPQQQSFSQPTPPQPAPQQSTLHRSYSLPQSPPTNSHLPPSPPTNSHPPPSLPANSHPPSFPSEPQAPVAHSSYENPPKSPSVQSEHLVLPPTEYDNFKKYVNLRKNNPASLNQHFSPQDIDRYENYFKAHPNTDIDFRFESDKPKSTPNVMTSGDLSKLYSLKPTNTNNGQIYSAPSSIPSSSSSKKNNNGVDDILKTFQGLLGGNKKHK